MNNSGWIVLAAVLALCPARGMAGPVESSDQGFISRLSEGAKALEQFKARGLATGEGASAVSYSPWELGPDSSWEDIKRWLFVRFPQVQFGARFISIDTLCSDGANIKPIVQRYTECARWDSGNSGERGSRCVEERPVLLSTPIHYSVKECVRWSPGTGERDPICLEERTVSRSHNLSPLVAVSRLDYSRGDGPREVPLFSKRYDIATCR